MKKLLLLIAGLILVSHANRYEHKYLVIPDASKITKKQSRDIECLAMNMYREARGEPHQGMIAVAFVTINRAKSEIFPSSLCEVVHQKRKNVCQFTWHCLKGLPKIDYQSYDYIRKVAKLIYFNSDKMVDPTKGALFYHADYVNPKWNREMKKTAYIGRHIFYRERTL